METVPNSSGRQASGGRTKPIVRVRANVSGEPAPQTSRAPQQRRRRRNSRASTQQPTSSTTSSTTQPAAQHLPVAPAWFAVSRAVALFLALLTLLNLFGDFHLQKLDAVFWWINLEPWPTSVARGLLATTAVLLLLFAAQVQVFRLVRYPAMLAVLTLLAMAAKNSLQFYAEVKSGAIETTAVFPVAVYSIVLLGIIFYGLLPGLRTETNPTRALLLGTFSFLLCLTGFPIAKMYCSGQTDLHEKADIAVIFAAPVSKTGKPSEALTAAVQTGCHLYKEGRVKKLILTGSSKMGDVSETSIMQQLAIKHGVPKEDLLIDAESTSINKSINVIAKLLEEQEQQQVLAVSTFYKLPRIQLGFKQAGLQVSTVPAHGETEKIKPDQIADEAVAFWKSCLGSLFKQ